MEVNLKMSSGLAAASVLDLLAFPSLSHSDLGSACLWPYCPVSMCGLFLPSQIQQLFFPPSTSVPVIHLLVEVLSGEMIILQK